MEFPRWGSFRTRGSLLRVSKSQAYSEAPHAGVRGVAKFGGMKGDTIEGSGGTGTTQVPFKKLAALFGFKLGEVGAIDGVVDALKINGCMGG